MLIASEVDFKELIFVYEVFGNLFEVFIGCSICFCAISEEECAFFEGKSTKFADCAGFFNALDRFLKEIVDYQLRFESSLLKISINLHTLL